MFYRSSEVHGNQNIRHNKIRLTTDVSTESPAMYSTTELSNLSRDG